MKYSGVQTVVGTLNSEQLFHTASTMKYFKLAKLINENANELL